MKMNVDTKALESICDNELGENAPAQCISGKYVDANQKPILYYFGNRIREPKQKLEVSRFNRWLNWSIYQVGH